LFEARAKKSLHVLSLEAEIASKEQLYATTLAQLVIFHQLTQSLATELEEVREEVMEFDTEADKLTAINVELLQNNKRYKKRNSNLKEEYKELRQAVGYLQETHQEIFGLMDIFLHSVPKRQTKTDTVALAQQLLDIFNRKPTH
jgi:chromosome segregation ATPase